MNSSVNWPLDSNVIRRGRINNTFGMVRRKANGSPRPHQGWDFHAPIGTPCYSIARGQVVSVRNAGAYGLQVLVKFLFDFDGDGQQDTLYAFYAHLSSVSVKAGDSVDKGSLIGKTGDSGNAKGMRGLDSHLHFEIRIQRWVGLGLSGRISPLAVFKKCPLTQPEYRINDPRLI